MRAFAPHPSPPPSPHRAPVRAFVCPGVPVCLVSTALEDRPHRASLMTRSTAGGRAAAISSGCTTCPVAGYARKGQLGLFTLEEVLEETPELDGVQVSV